MDTQLTTPVEIVQELIAIHTTRKELCDKITVPESNGNTAAAKQQSDEFIAELMNELSGFGDAVQSEADRENEYQVMYKKALPDFDAMSPEESGQTFQAMEDCLKKIYRSLLETETTLPDSLQEIIAAQQKKL